jgi:AcrR family transcriptional regulator
MAEAGSGVATSADGRALRWEHRKPELLRAATDYVLETGVADLTLRPLGAAIGASITTLIRQFGSKDELIREVCKEIHGEMTAAFDRFWASSDGRPIEVLRALWDLWLAPEYERQFVLLFELYGLALRQPGSYEWFVQSVVHDWRAPLENALRHDGVDPAKAEALATLVVGIIRGLYLDRAATGDASRVNDAYDLALDLLGPAFKPSDA